MSGSDAEEEGKGTSFETRALGRFFIWLVIVVKLKKVKWAGLGK